MSYSRKNVLTEFGDKESFYLNANSPLYPLLLKLTIVLLLFSVTSFTLTGQTITGTIYDDYYKPLAGVHIKSSNNHHIHADDNGSFEFKNISISDTLKISHIGFESTTVVIEKLDEPLSIFLESKIIALNAIVIGTKADAVKVIANADVKLNPVNSSQDLLTKVPGLFIGQHAGGGKAEQIFLRGFDVDHGTDIGITVDGLPVNMVSHAHGQGYADLHFVIPETIEKIDLGKGPYYADKGNFNTAGYINFEQKSRLDRSLVKLEAGQFNTQRILTMFNLVNNEDHGSYIAAEYTEMDGPFESPQNFNRINLFGKYAYNINKLDKLDVTFSYFKSKWDASGQIPERSIANGDIGRFGAIDNTEGGNTSRTNIVVKLNKFLTENSSINNSVYLSHYDFELFSNFTFFLEDPINGDQIRQYEDRTTFGLNSDYKYFFPVGNMNGQINAGISLRNDLSEGNELSYTANRSETIRQLSLGDIDETNFGAYLQGSLEFHKWTITSALRLDHFNFQYKDDLITNYSQEKVSRSILSPKFNAFYNQNRNLQLYFKAGKGFHTNDTRVVIANEGEQILPAAYGADAGFVWKAYPDLIVNAAYWYLFLEQEFVYVGDAGIVEPSGKTRRQGVELSLRYQPKKWLYWNFDANYTIPRAIEELPGENYIPLATDFTLLSSVTFQGKSGFYGSANVRYIKDRPANEDFSITAEGYTIVDMNAGYKWRNLTVGFHIQNLLNSEWKETQFATESRLFDEDNPVEEIHFTPGNPFFIKGIIGFSF